MKSFWTTPDPRSQAAWTQTLLDWQLEARDARTSAARAAAHARGIAAMSRVGVVMLSRQVTALPLPQIAWRFAVIALVPAGLGAYYAPRYSPDRARLVAYLWPGIMAAFAPVIGMLVAATMPARVGWSRVGLAVLTTVGALVMASLLTPLANTVFRELAFEMYQPRAGAPPLAPEFTLFEAIRQLLNEPANVLLWRRVAVDFAVALGAGAGVWFAGAMAGRRFHRTIITAAFVAYPLGLGFEVLSRIARVPTFWEPPVYVLAYSAALLIFAMLLDRDPRNRWWADASPRSQRISPK